MSIQKAFDKLLKTILKEFVTNNDHTAIMDTIYQMTIVFNKINNQDLKTIVNIITTDWVDINFPDPQTNDNLLTIAIVNSASYSTLQTLVDAGINVEIHRYCPYKGGNLLTRAVENSASNRTLQLLIDAGIYFNDQNLYGETALMLAESENTVKFLLDTGINIDLTCTKNCTALHYLITSNIDKNQKEACIKMLINAGANVNIKDLYKRSSPLMLAIMYSKTIVHSFINKFEPYTDPNPLIK